ncbi:acanthoscurrin-2-like [Cimex lectularius]|uniref:Uncharacterized protein n=1 Tax=Cimex lectularius TaxID=79782 RepID=A0A8I6RY53_CIMLE|nr:acanthoscurrin-2-like [Cimex lectularius]
MFKGIIFFAVVALVAFEATATPCGTCGVAKTTCCTSTPTCGTLGGVGLGGVGLGGVGLGYNGVGYGNLGGVGLGYNGVGCGTLGGVGLGYNGAGYGTLGGVGLGYNGVGCGRTTCCTTAPTCGVGYATGMGVGCGNWY